MPLMLRAALVVMVVLLAAPGPGLAATSLPSQKQPSVIVVPVPDAPVASNQGFVLRIRIRPGVRCGSKEDCIAVSTRENVRDTLVISFGDLFVGVIECEEGQDGSQAEGTFYPRKDWSEEELAADPVRANVLRAFFRSSPALLEFCGRLYKAVWEEKAPEP